MYDVEPHVAGIYDQSETYTDDVKLIRCLIGERGPWRILEPFCGTGRILIPLAADAAHPHCPIPCNNVSFFLGWM
jgi:hypothetical protein